MKRILIFISALLAFPVAAADLKVFSTIALNDSWPELKPAFEKRGLHNVTHFAAAVLVTTWPVNAYPSAQLVEFLNSRDTQALFKAKGFELPR